MPAQMNETILLLAEFHWIISQVVIGEIDPLDQR
jgi:hypothetical protein